MLAGGAEDPVGPYAAATPLLSAQLAGSWALLGAPELAPLDISHWAVHAAALGLVAAMVLVRVGERGWQHVAVRAGTALAVAYLVLRPLVAARWPGATAAVVVLATAATLVVYWLGLDVAVRRAGGARAGATLLLVASGAAAAVTAASGTLVVAQLGGAAVAGVGALWLLGLRFSQPAIIAGAIPGTAMAGWWMAALGVLYAAMSPAVALALLAIPLAAVAADEFASRLSVGRRAALVLMAAVAAAALAVGIAAPAALRTDDGASDPAGDYGYE